MNIEDKKQLFTEINRVLRKDGILAIEAMMAGNKEEIRFPVYWADSPHVSFIITPDRLRQVLMEAGFDEITWMDVTPISIELGQKVLAASTDFSQPVGIHLVYSDVPLKAKNTFQGLEDGTYLNSYGVFRRQLD